MTSVIFGHQPGQGFPHNEKSLTLMIYGIKQFKSSRVVLPSVGSRGSDDLSDTTPLGRTNFVGNSQVEG